MSDDKFLAASQASRRTPQMSTHLNSADRIERRLAQDRHTKWGFVIYRCTYESDSEWTEALSRLRKSTETCMEFYNGMDMLENMLFTVIEDKQTLDEASTSTVRENFKQWIRTALQQEQGGDSLPGESGRYNYCISINAESLRSILAGSRDGFVNIISANWLPTRERLLQFAAEHPNRRVNLNPRVPVKEPVEGCTEPDVGWMKVCELLHSRLPRSAD